MAEILTEAERARINAAVEAAERGTSGEIVPVIVRASDDYPGARWRFAVGFMLAVVALSLLIAPTEGIYILAALVPALFFGHLLAAMPPVLRIALAQSELDEEVRQRAQEAFLDLGLSGTRDRTGVLLFVSLLEHRIEILADVGIDTKAPPGFWNEVVVQLGIRLRRGQIAEGIAEAVESIGKLLAEEFPRKGDDRDELRSGVVTPDR